MFSTRPYFILENKTSLFFYIIEVSYLSYIHVSESVSIQKEFEIFPHCAIFLRLKSGKEIGRYA